MQPIAGEQSSRHTAGSTSGVLVLLRDRSQAVNQSRKNRLDTEPLPAHSEMLSQWPKDHCDYLLDTIDAQLDQMQPHSHVQGVSGGAMEGVASYAVVSHTTEMERRPGNTHIEASDGTSLNGADLSEDKDTKREEYTWRLTQLLGTEQTGNMGYQSDSNSAESVCTEDFVAKFREGMVDPKMNSTGERDHEKALLGGFGIGEGALEECLSPEDSHPDSSVGIKNLLTPLDNCTVAGDFFTMSTARRQDFLQQFKEEMENTLQEAMSTSEGTTTRNRTDSLESLGGRISRLSQTNFSESKSLLDEEKMSTVESNDPSEDHTGLQTSVDSETGNSVDTCIAVNLQQDTTCEGVSLGGLQYLQEVSLPLRVTLSREEQRFDHQSRPPDDDADFIKLHNPDPQSLKEASESDQNMLPACTSSSSPKILSIGPSLTSETELTVKPTNMDYPNNSLSSEIDNSLKAPDQLGAASEMLGGTTYWTRNSEDIQTPSLLADNRGQNNWSATLDSSWEISYDVEPKEDKAHCKLEKPSGHSAIAMIYGAEAGYTEGNKSHFKQHYQPDRKLCTLCSRPNLEARSTEPLPLHFNIESTVKEDHMDTAPCKHLAGVPVMNFDGVTIDSDLDSVRTEKVRTHFRKAMGDRKGPGLSTRRSRCQRKELRRTSSSKTASDDDDGEGGFQQALAPPGWRSSSPVRWRSGTTRAADSSWDCTEYSPGAFLHRWGSSVEELAAERSILEDSVGKLRLDLALEEERLSHRRSHIREADQSLSDIAQQKKQMLQELESLRQVLDISHKDVMKAESRMKESQSRAEEKRTELALLEYKRDTSLKELQELEQELSVIRRQCSSAHNSQLVVFQSEISSLVAERDELKVRLRHLEGSISFMERQELERQLNYAKAELFSEQRAARARVQELQECLEESQSKVDNKTAEGAMLQEKILHLSSQLRELERTKEAKIQMQAAEAGEQKQVFNQQIMDLTSQVSEQETKISALEKILSEKELQFLSLREVISTMGAEKEAQVMAMEILKQEHSRRLVELQQEKKKEKELQLIELRKELQSSKQQELQQFAESVEQIKAGALKDQAASFRKEAEKLVTCLESKDEEIAKLKEGIQLQKASMKKLAGELKHEAKEMVQSSLLGEQRTWEAEKREALQLQRESLEEERHRALAAMKEALERERRTSLALQNKSIELQNRIQEQELHSRSLQREKQEALEELHAALREEKLEELRKLREELEQERALEVDRLKVRLLQLEEEQRLLQTEQSEASFREKELQAQVERAERSLVREISSACERLQDPLQGTPGRARATSPSRTRHGSPSRLSSSHALQVLNELSEETHQYIQELRQEVEAQKRTVLHIQREKERELKQQREQSHLEKEAALDALKERLIQEHIEEITNLQRNQLRESGSGESQTLRQQLREKDNELRAIQRNMARWKDETACKLARKFEEELNAELEKRFSRNKPANNHRKPETLESEMQRLCMERSESSHLRSTSSPSLNVASSHGQHDFGALKMLRQLQGRVRELRAESTVCHGGSLEDLSTLRGDLGSSYREKRHKLSDHSFSQFVGASGRK